MGDSAHIDKRPRRWADVGQLVALLTTALVLAYLSWSGYYDATSKAEQTTAGIARVNAFALDTALSTADMLLAETAASIAPMMDKRGALSAAWQAEIPRLRIYLTRIPQLNSIRVFDTRGDQILSTDETATRINIVDRPHFIEARDKPEQGLIISDVVVSRTTNRNAVILLRAIRDPSGRFIGAVSVPLDLAYFERLLADAKLGSDGTASIRRVDSNRIITRLPALPGIINRSDPTHPAHQRILLGEHAGTVASVVQPDGSAHVVSFQRLEHYPLYVSVGIARATVLHEWQIRAVVSVLLAALALLSVSMFYRRMATTNRLLSSVLEAASEVAIIATNRNGVITLFNAGAENLLGYRANEVIGQRRFDEFVARDPASATLPSIDSTLAQQAGAGPLEGSFRHADGHLVHVSQLVAVLAARHPGAGYLCIAHDIAQQKRNSGLQAAQNRVLEMIARGEPLPNVLEQLIRGIENQVSDVRCAVLLFDPESGTLRHGAAPSLPDGYLRTLDGLLIGAHRHSGATSAFLHEATFIDDLPDDPRWSPLHEAADAAGIKALWSTPILDAAEHLLGVFIVHRNKIGIDVDTVEEFVDIATHTAAIGITSAHAAAAQEAGEKRMRLALRAADMDAYEYVPATNRVHRSGDVTAAWGLAQAGSGHEYISRIHPDDLPSLYAALEKLAPATPDYAIEYRFKKLDGSYIWVADWASAIFDAQGTLDRVFGVCRDVTARRTLEESLRQHQQHLETLVAERTDQLSSSEANLRLILESTADGLYGVDKLGRLTFINPAACRMLGLDADALIGKPIHPIIHHHFADGRDYEASHCPTTLTLTHGEVMTISDEVYWHADGHPVPVLYSTHPMVSDGQIVGAVVSFMDVTERRALEEAREQARQAAEHLARVKSEFLANMSHEIRTPLNGILGFARMGYRDCNDLRAREVFGHILDSGNLLLGVVNDILDFSKIEAGKLKIEAVSVDLPNLLRSIVATFAERAESRGLDLNLRLAQELPDGCRTDPLRVGQILTNLLSNALKFTEQGQVCLDANLDGEELVFRVTDTGIGISATKLDSLFDAFEQADSSTTRRFGGTGLGLAITKRLVQLFDGSIHATSTVGQGSTFEVRLPYVSAMPPAEPTPTGNEVGTTTCRLAGLRILAAEDNEVNQLVLEDLLVSEGADVTLVDNGRAAVEAITREGPNAFDVVLMDIQMPEMDGYAATRRIHGIAPDLPVIGQTAHALAEERAKCLEAGMVAHVAKPLDADQLVNLVLRHNSRRTLAALTHDHP